MKIIRFKSTRLSYFIVCCVVLIFAHTTVAQAAVRNGAAQTSATNCAFLQVQLHGSQPATSTCVSRGKVAAKTTGLMQPHTYVTGCSAAALELTALYHAGGYTICFIGSGFIANLTSYCGPGLLCLFWNWNDNVEYFSSGCSSGTFYMDSNGNGKSQRFGPHVSHNFPYGKVGADQLSSLKLDSNCTE